MNTPPNPATAPMHAARRAAAAAARTRAEKAIRMLVKDGKPITISAVAARADVSRGYLHRHPDLGPKIRAYRDRHMPTSTDSRPSTTLTALREHLRHVKHDHATELAQANARIRQLEQELASALGAVITLRQQPTPQPPRPLPPVDHTPTDNK